jgi:DNA-binding MarR family transcriptional regulator
MARDLAEELQLKLPNLHQRLKTLEEAGALAKREDHTAERGRRYIWSAPPKCASADAARLTPLNN